MSRHCNPLISQPGWKGLSVPALAQLYVDLLERLDLNGVTVIGSSFGGWVAAEIALLANRRVELRPRRFAETEDSGYPQPRRQPRLIEQAGTRERHGLQVDTPWAQPR